MAVDAKTYDGNLHNPDDSAWNGLLRLISHAMAVHQETGLDQISSSILRCRIRLLRPLIHHLSNHHRMFRRSHAESPSHLHLL